MRITIECRPEELKDYSALIEGFKLAFCNQGFTPLGYDTPTLAEFQEVRYEPLWLAEWTPYDWDREETDVPTEMDDLLEGADHQIMVMCSDDPCMWDLMAFEKIGEESK